MALPECSLDRKRFSLWLARLPCGLKSIIENKQNIKRAAYPRGSVRTSHSAAPGLNTSSAEIFLLNCLVGGQY